MNKEKLCALIPLAEFKAVLGIDDRENSLAAFCLVSATCSIEQYCKRRFLRRKHTEYLTFTGEYLFNLREYPVRKVLAIHGGGKENMLLHGRDCRLTILTVDREIVLPYSEETIREVVYMLAEEASIEGGGNRRAIRLPAGTTGCVITPLTIGTVPLLWVLALGEAEPPLFVSETRNLYKHTLRLVPQEDSPAFSLIRERGNERIRYGNCRVSGFELRIMRETAGAVPETLFLRMDISGDSPPEPYLVETDSGLVPAERFKENGVRYFINGVEYHGIYGLTVTTEKKSGTKTEVWIKRVIREGEEFPISIESLTVTARLFRDHYEWRLPGTFRLTLSGLLLMTDETSINTSGPVIGPLRYYCAGGITAEVYSENDIPVIF
jgi:hypothetical protein